MENELLQRALESFYSNSPLDCERACGEILTRQADHPLGCHLMAWALQETGRCCGDWLGRIASSSESSRTRGLPATASLGWLLWQEGRTGEAIRALTDHIQREPNRQDLQTVLGICLLADDQPAPAAGLLRAVVRQSPRNPVPRFHLAQALLHLGDWESGWKEFEQSRFDLDVRQSGQYEWIPEKRWKGQDLEGGTLVIEGEQGFGDQIQFVRFAEWIKRDRGASRVVFSCHPDLVGLMKRVPFLDEVSGQIYRDFDYHIPVMSLPALLGLRVHHRLFTAPYLEAEPAMIHRWKMRLGEKRKSLRVGICWRSAPMAVKGDRVQKVKGINFVKRQKSLSLDDLKSLLRSIDRSGDVDLISLQYQPGGEEEALLDSFGVVQPEIGNFNDTAALIELCDRVITIDTSVAHLAGAMGRATSLLLAKGADWRWTHQTEEKSAWYPSLVAFRQAAERDWSHAIEGAVSEMKWGREGKARQASLSNNKARFD